MERTDLNPELAETFLRRLGKHLDYNINIMDRNGVIIASRDPLRVGSFHEAAQRLIETGADIGTVEPGDNLPVGVRPGVNLPIELKGKTIGVVGVTGDPKVVAPVGYAIKTSVESMVELELYKDRAHQRSDRKNLLINYLLFEETPARNLLEGLATKLGYDTHLPRVPLLLAFRDGTDVPTALATIKQNGVHGPEDFSWITPDGRILVFLTVTFSGIGIIADFEKSVVRYVAAAEQALSKGIPDADGTTKPDLRAWAGTFQSDLAHYRAAYRHVLWLAGRFPVPVEKILYFYPYADEYLSSRVPRLDYVEIFDSFLGLLPTEFPEELKSTIDALLDSAFNGKEAAHRLGVHRNTLLARIEKVRQLVGMDLRRDPKAREFLGFLSRYLEQRGNNHSYRA